jgi:hypothetical protein
MAGKTIQIYVPSGDPRGMRIAEITTRIVRSFEIPRAQVSSFIERDESTQVGVYFLFGDSELGLPLVYIGQSGGVGQRLNNHNVHKEFWNRAIAFVSLTNNWTQTHVTYLEWLCINTAQRIDRYRLENSNSGSKPFTPEALEADCQEVFDTIRILLTTLGYPIFEQLANSESSPQLVSNTREYFCEGKGNAKAKGQYTSEGFVVFRGSHARRQLVESLQAYLPFVQKRQILIDSGKLRDCGETFEFTEDTLFSSPSQASSMVLGRSSNGWIDWITQDKKTLDSIERKSSQDQPDPKSI